MAATQVLILGTEDPTAGQTLPPELEVTFSPRFESPSPRTRYQLVLLDRTPSPEECFSLHRVTPAHTLFYTPRVDPDRCSQLLLCKKAAALGSQTIPDFLRENGRWFFPGSYGEKFHLYNLSAAFGFSGQVNATGSASFALTGSFGPRLTQAAYWRNPIPIQAGQTLDFWLEYRATPGVDVALQVMLTLGASVDQVAGIWTWNRQDLEQMARVTAPQQGFLSFSVLAAGTGTLEIITLHNRFSRGPFGYFLPGGQRRVTSRREEIFSYFDPGDRKPPLAVYFSGYRPQEGFEAYRLIRSLGTPFLLLFDARLEGGSFYQGSAEYENDTLDVIRSCMEELGFGPDQVVLSGLSMGSSGALYYGCALQPHAVIVGKPLMSLGDIALNQRLVRPNEFDTSLDILMNLEGRAEAQAAEPLNQHFWDRFRAADWSHTQLAVTYMMEDDYESTAYSRMVQALARSNAQIYGRGFHGRHNDNTGGIVQWFMSQYQRILREDFAPWYNPFRQEENQ